MFLIRSLADIPAALQQYKGQLVEFTIPKTGTPILMHVVGAEDALLDHLVDRAFEEWTSKANE